jgi:glycosyltransferase involved in cell wall biosynthesis
LRILHVAYIYPPKLRVADGITTVVYNVTKELARRGHQVSVYTSDMLDLHGNTSLSANHSVINGVDVYYSRSVWRSKTFIVTPSTISLLSKNIDNFDIIHIHDARSFQGISTYLFAKIKNVPYVFQPHGSYLSSLPDSPSKAVAKTTLEKLVSGEIIGNASKVIALSRVEAEQYKRMGVPEEKIAIIPNGIDLSEYASLPPKGAFKKRFDIKEEEKIVLYLGRIHRLKGIDFLVKSFAYLVKNGLENVKLVIAGPDDGYLYEAKSLVSLLGVSGKVLFTGLLNECDKVSAFVDSSLVVSPEKFNVFLLVPLEAAACGKPVIVSSTNYISYMIREGGFGFSVKYGNITELAETMGKMLTDDELLREMGQRGRKYMFENCDWTNSVAKLEKVYEEALS